jgi:hypothetical protein
VIAGHFFGMWRDNDIAPDRIQVDCEPRVLAFIDAARRDLQYRAFVAESEGGSVVGSASCQLFAGLYPDILMQAQRRYGYLWGVYVEPEERPRGSRGDSQRQQLPTSRPSAARTPCSTRRRRCPLYAGLGFAPTNEMRLALIE